MTISPVVDPGGRVDPQAAATFDDFVAARSQALLRTAYLLTHDHALAEDLLQTSLAKAWFSWKRIHGEPEPYVRKILVNTYARPGGAAGGTASNRPRSCRRARPRSRPLSRPTSGRRWSGCRAGCAR